MVNVATTTNTTAVLFRDIILVVMRPVPFDGATVNRAVESPFGCPEAVTAAAVKPSAVSRVKMVRGCDPP